MQKKQGYIMMIYLCDFLEITNLLVQSNRTAQGGFASIYFLQT